MKNIKYNKKVFESEQGTNIIYDALYCGSPCYAILHVLTAHIELIDHSDDILKSLTNRIKRSSAMTCDKKANGYIFKLYPTKTERQITLRYYVYAKYNGLRLNQVRGKNICLYDDSAVKDNILDLRSCNLYDAGGIRAHTNAREITIEERPESGEKYIAISFPDRKNGQIEYTEYSPQLYEMLARSTYCSLSYNPHNDRALVTVHYANNKNGYVLDNLTKFILIYNLHFEQYRNTKGGIKRFIHDYYKLSREKYKDKDAAHINACRWNNCFGNLLFMDATGENRPNSEMSDYIKWFSSPYKVYTTTNGKGEILIEFTGMDFTSYYKCSTPEDYAAWQKVFLGKKLTSKLQVVTYATKDGVQQELTPQGMIKAGLVDKEIVKSNEPDFWRWLERRDNLLAMDDNAFHVWRAGAGRTISVPMPDGIVAGQPFIVPMAAGYAIVTLEKVKENSTPSII